MRSASSAYASRRARIRWLACLARVASIGAAAVLALFVLRRPALADEGPNVPPANSANASRISATDPLNGGFLVVNMQGMLFHPGLDDIREDLAYARWLGGGVVRVFATDSSGIRAWDGTQVGMRLAEIAPLLRDAHLRVIVALVNNHQAVPGEALGSAGWMDNYMQLLLPFYTTTWRGAYGQFVHDLVTTVNSRQALDVIYAWELGNELHTPTESDALVPFITQDAQEVRVLAPDTPILAGTMGANHIQPGDQHSPIARWLYCDAPVDAYTLHTYDWVSPERPGDMPIDWDLNNIVATPCPNGRALPVIVEELGTSRALAGVYTAQDEQARLQQELHQIEFVSGYPRVAGFGIWNGESPRVVDRTFVDTRRGLTSYGSNALGGGSCYDPAPDRTPGVRCQLEQALRGITFVRVDHAQQWAPGPGADPTASDPLVGSIDPKVAGEPGGGVVSITGWVRDPLADAPPGVQNLGLFVGSKVDGGTPVASAQLGLARSDVAAGSSDAADSAQAQPGFAIRLGPGDLPVGSSVLTLAAQTATRGTWLNTLHVVVPNLGLVPPPRVPVEVSVPSPLVVAAPRLQAEIQSPQPGDQIQRSFVMQLLAPSADRVDVYLEPDRDAGGRLVGFATQPPGAPFKVTVTAPLNAHTLYIHVISTSLGQEVVVAVPVVVRS